jgi:uncharacterized membrane protein
MQTHAWRSQASVMSLAGTQVEAMVANVPANNALYTALQGLGNQINNVRVFQ